MFKDFYEFMKHQNDKKSFFRTISTWITNMLFGFVFLTIMVAPMVTIMQFPVSFFTIILALCSVVWVVFMVWQLIGFMEYKSRRGYY